VHTHRGDPIDWARACLARGEYGRAVEILDLEVTEAQATHGPESLEVAHLLNELGVACKFAGRLDEADTHYECAVRLVEQNEGAECDDMATLLHNLGGLAHSRRRFADGIGPARSGFALRQRLHGANDVDVARDAAALAALLEGLGDNVEAEELYRRAIVIFDGAGEVCEAAIARNGLGSTCQSLDRFDEAETHYSAALAQFESNGEGYHPQVAHILNNLATLHRRRGDDVNARELLDRAYDILLNTLGPDHPVSVEVAANKRRVEAAPSPYGV